MNITILQQYSFVFQIQSCLKETESNHNITMILGHGANTMTLEEARMKLCAQAK